MIKILLQTKNIKKVNININIIEKIVAIISFDFEYNKLQGIMKEP